MYCLPAQAARWGMSRHEGKTQAGFDSPFSAVSLQQP